MATTSPASCAWVFTWLALLGVVPPALGLDPAYLKQWPGLERVLEDFQGSDEFDTLARQSAALNQLDRAIEDMADDRRWNNLTKDEIALRGLYRRAVADMRERVKARLSNELGPGFHWPWEEAPLQQWFSLQWQYESDPGFRAATLSRYLSAPLLEELNARKAASDARAQATGRELLRGIGYEPSTWSQMSGGEQDAMVSTGLMLIFLLLVMLVREMRRFGLLPKDVGKLRAGFRVYEVSRFTGVMQNYETSRGGTRESFQLLDGSLIFEVGISMAQVNIPDGHRVTAAWIYRSNKQEKFWYLLFVDHDSGAIRPVKIILRRLFDPGWWLLVPIVGLAFLTGIASDWVPASSPFFRGLLLAVIAAAVGGLAGDWIRRRRIGRFVRRDGPRILAAGKVGD